MEVALIICIIIVSMFMLLYFIRHLIIVSTPYHAYISWKDFKRYQTKYMTFFDTHINFDYDWYLVFHLPTYILFFFWYINKSINNAKENMHTQIIAPWLVNK